MAKQYLFRAVGGDAVEAFLNEMASQGYVLVNIQPVGRRIRETSAPELGTEEVVFSFGILLEREVKLEQRPG